ncbi:hypothetical protein D1818_05820 [Aquimarina sp. BL5]|uniref:hypothetical protein n=1 Tax=Aquimarina sp. BL5 TaxID=1714860 RepID=UPI000E542BAF|nr:hypothetical protein [Aquimarina sp. BL5]AXT50368.1 hypothetical protein D1818_05820 [Aquimarina sp. BL5]
MKKNTEEGHKKNAFFEDYKKEVFYLIGFSIFLFLIIFLVTRNVKWFSYSLLGLGEIGDAIGGITAPFINLLAAILVYLHLLKLK